MNTGWQNIEDTLTSNCQEVLGRKKQQQKEWISMDTARMIEEKKQSKTAVISNSSTRTAETDAQEEYVDANIDDQ